MIFGINTVEFAEMQKLKKNKEKVELVTKIALFGYFGRKFEKVLSYLKSASSNLQKFEAKSKIPNFGTKNA